VRAPSSRRRIASLKQSGSSPPRSIIGVRFTWRFRWTCPISQ
jgi:hypothetical protein